MDYELYHDESLEAGYWHGMLLVPKLRKCTLIEYLEQARDNTKVKRPLSLKVVRKEGRVLDCVEAWSTIGIDSLMSKTRSKEPQPVYLGNHTLDIFRKVIGAKLIIFRVTCGMGPLRYVNEFGRKVEVTLRMGLKGGLNLLGQDDEYITITKLHFDGNEQYHGKRLSRQNIIEKLHGLRDYCSFSNDQDIIDDRSSKHDKSGCQPYEDCQILQLTDILVGSFRSLLSPRCNPKHKRVLVFPRALIERYFEGHARMQNSRWRNSLCMSQCTLENNQWKFEPVCMEPRNKTQDYQLLLSPLFDAPSLVLETAV